MGYDRSSTMYSPDGRIIQTEYARNAMRRGSISIALKSKAGVVLAGEMRVTDFDIPNHKISKVDEHFSAIFAGFAADGRLLINRARVEAQIHKMTYGTPADIGYIATKLADYAHMYTQQGGLRPLGIGLLLGGLDYNGQPTIYYVYPGGGLTETNAKAIGSNDSAAMEYLKSNYKEDLTLEELIELAKNTIKNSSEGITDELIEVWSIEASESNIPTVEQVY